MNQSGAKIRDIIIGILLIVIGGATMLHTLGIVVFDETFAIMSFVYLLIGIGGVLIVSFFFSPQKIWLMILGICLLFVAMAAYIGNFWPSQEILIPTALFMMLSLAFFVFFIIRPQQWWAMLTGWITLGLAGTVYVSETRFTLPFLKAFSYNDLAPLVLFSGAVLGFVFVWLTKPRDRWWSLLTAGMITSVMTIIVGESLNLPETAIPMMLFFSSGITFLLVWMLKNDEHRLQWAIYPATVLIGFAAFLYFVSYWMDDAQMVFAILFLVLGVFFLGNYFRSALLSKSRPVYNIIEPKKADDLDGPAAWESEDYSASSTSDEERDSLSEDLFQEDTEVEKADEEKEDLVEEEIVAPPADYAIDGDDDITDDEDKD
jgi:hypothetical protein